MNHRSLLLSILGELLLQQGDIACAATTTAYCGHDSWILNASARDNILVGHNLKTVDEERYRYAVTSCALKEDFMLWRDGERTLLGQRGINISGGQKARIALARAIYSEAPLLLLDNVLAGLDVATSASVFQEAILRTSNNRVVLLCSHMQQFYPYASGIIQVSEGTARLIEQKPLEPPPLSVTTSSLALVHSKAEDIRKATFAEVPSAEANSYVEYSKVNILILSILFKYCVHRPQVDFYRLQWCSHCSRLPHLLLQTS